MAEKDISAEVRNSANAQKNFLAQISEFRTHTTLLIDKFRSLSFAGKEVSGTEEELIKEFDKLKLVQAEGTGKVFLLVKAIKEMASKARSVGVELEESYTKSLGLLSTSKKVEIEWRAEALKNEAKKAKEQLKIDINSLKERIKQRKNYGDKDNQILVSNLKKQLELLGKHGEDEIKLRELAQRQELRNRKKDDLKSQVWLGTHTMNIGKIWEGFTASTKLGFLEITDKVGLALKGLSKGLGPIGLLITAYEFLSAMTRQQVDVARVLGQSTGYTGKTLDTAGNAMARMATNVNLFGHGLIDVGEATSLLKSASEEAGFNLVYLGDSIDKVSKGGNKARLEMMNVMSKAITRIAMISKGLGLPVDQTVKSMTRLGVMFRINAKDLPKDFENIVNAAAGMQVPVGMLTGALEETGETFRYTGAGIDKTLTVFGGFIKTTDDLKKTMGGFWEKALPRDMVSIARAGLKAIGQISAEEYLAYMGGPITDIGVAWKQAVDASPIEKLRVAYDRLVPLAKATGTKNLAGTMALMFPGLKQLGPLGMRVSEMIVKMGEAGTFQKKGIKTTGDFLKYIAKEMPDVTQANLEQIGAQMGMVGDPLKNLVIIVKNLAVGIIAPFATDVMKFLVKITAGITNANTTASLRTLEKTTETIQEVGGGYKRSLSRGLTDISPMVAE